MDDTIAEVESLFARQGLLIHKDGRANDENE